MRKTILIITIIVMILSMGVMMFACTKPTPLNEIKFDEGVKGQDNSLAEGANVRIMTYNLQVNAWGGKNRSDPKERARRFEQMICYYLPDVIGMQEVCDSWHLHFSATTKANYKIMFSLPTEFTTMAYNIEKVELIKKGIVKYSKHHEKFIQEMRYVAYGIFKHKASGETFIVTSTHLDYMPNEETMNLQVQELTNFINETLKEYDNCPVFAVGDYNCYERVDEKILDHGHKVYEKLIETTKLTDANYIEGIQIQEGSKVKWNDSKWDHILVNEPENIKKFAIISDEYYTKVSDHYPVFVDAKI